MTASEVKRAAILEAALAEFEEKGFTGANMDRVAERAGVSKRTVYNHFEGKAALFRAILARMRASVAAQSPPPYDPSRPLRDQLMELGAAKGAVLRSQAFMRVIRLAATEVLRDRALAAELGAQSDDAAPYAAFFRGAAEAGAIATEDPAVPAEQFLGMIKAQAFWPHVFSGDTVGEAEMARVVETTVDAVLAAHAKA